MTSSQEDVVGGLQITSCLANLEPPCPLQWQHISKVGFGHLYLLLCRVRIMSLSGVHGAMMCTRRSTCVQQHGSDLDSYDHIQAPHYPTRKQVQVRDTNASFKVRGWQSTPSGLIFDPLIQSGREDCFGGCCELDS